MLLQHIHQSECVIISTNQNVLSYPPIRMSYYHINQSESVITLSPLSALPPTDVTWPGKPGAPLSPLRP